MCWTAVACRSCIRRNAGVEPPEEERCPAPSPDWKHSPLHRREQETWSRTPRWKVSTSMLRAAVRHQLLRQGLEHKGGTANRRKSHEGASTVRQKASRRASTWCADHKCKKDSTRRGSISTCTSDHEATLPVEQECRSLLEELGGSAHPEAKAEQHARIHIQADHQSAGRRHEPLDNARCTLVSTLKPSARADLSKTTTRCTRRWEQRGQSSRQRAARSERTVRHQTARGTP